MYLKEMALELAEVPGTPLVSGAHTSAAELRATLRFRIDYVALAPAGLAFISTAQALQCPAEGSNGLKADVTEVVLTSTGLFNGRGAGQSLNSFVRCYTANSPAEFPLSQLADSLNTRRGQESRINLPIVLRISPKPTDNARQQFHVRVRVAGGQEIAQTTPDIIWN
ncbi:hypothetical protein GCM10022407_38990 [Hymenobacter antarcticus]|uniref:Uncharacterized protein n=1 Tax=Hymenobacter antarcticus TaxID=486270 RepID=A0ABP7R2I0_9BACT